MTIYLKDLVKNPRLLNELRDQHPKQGPCCCGCGVLLQETITGRRKTPNGLVAKKAVSIDKTETSSYIENSANAPPAETAPVTPPINPEPTPPQSDEIKSDHPAIALVRSLMRSYPNRINWPEIVAALGSTPDKHRASQCYAEWVGRGSNPRSIKPFTEWYCTGIPTQRKPGSYQPAEQP